MPRPINGVDVERVSAWLVEHVEGAQAPFEFSLIVGGRSNLTFAVRCADGRRLVVRRPPLGHVLATAHDMAREHRMISAVGATGVPVPPTFGLCTDVSVNGSPFYVMGFVEGAVLDSPEKAALLSTELRQPASEHLVDVLCDLHALDVDAIGLGDLGKRDGYVERQFKRWSAQWANSKTRELPAVDEVARRLSERVPVQQGVVVAHGDYRFGNCITDVEHGRIAAVLDWELCTLGDPLADLGYLCVYWTDHGAVPRRPNDPSGAEGFPDFRQLLERYARRTGRDLTCFDFYVAFSSWRLAVISEGVYARYLHGQMGDATDTEVIATFKVATEQLAEAALEALGG